MGLVDDVTDTFRILKNTTVRFLQIWIASWALFFFGSLGWIGLSMVDYMWAFGLPSFATAAAVLYYMTEITEETDPAFLNRQAPSFGYSRYAERDAPRDQYDSRVPSRYDRQPVSTVNRYGTAATSRYRSGTTYSSSTVNARSNYDAPVSPVPSRYGSSYGGGSSSGGIMKMRNNYSSIVSILKNVIYPGVSNRAALTEAQTEMDRVEEEYNNQHRAPGTASLSPHYLLLVKDDDFTQLRGIFKYLGDNRLRRVWGSFPDEYLSIEDIERHRSPDGQPSRQLKYQSATKYFDELPCQEGVFNELADAFTMPKLQPNRSAAVRPTARPPLANSNPNANTGYGASRTTFTPKSNFTTSSASTGARMGPGGRTTPYASCSPYSSNSYNNGGLYSSGGSAYGSSSSNNYSSSSYASSNYNKSSAYGGSSSFDDRPVGGGSRMQESARGVYDDPYTRPAASNVRRKGELVEIAW